MAKNNFVPTTSSNIIIPRPRSAFTAGTVRLDDYSHQWWMHEYHKQQQQRKQQQQQQHQVQNKKQPAQSTPLGSTNTKDSSNSTGSKKSKGSNLFLNFSSLKISPCENGFSKKPLCARTDGKSEHPETLDGYRIYKGTGYLALGLSRQNTMPHVVNGNDEHKPSDHQALSPYTPLILPDKFILATDKSYGYEKSSPQTDHYHHHQQHHHLQQAPRQATASFQIHLQNQRRSRPQSASSDFQHHSSAVHKERKGTKTKHSVKKVKPLPQPSYRAPTVTTIQLQSSEAISLTPRQNGSLVTPPPHTTVQVTHPKPEQSPKSILKNNRSEDIINTSQSVQLSSGSYHKTLPFSYQKLKPEFAYHELVVPSGKNGHILTSAVPRHSPQYQLSATPKATATMIGPRRPKSASATTSRYELIDRSSSPGRKSVTFNSFVSFLSENKISTIRSLPVDV